MSRIRLIASLAAMLVTLAFATSALAAGGGSPGDDDFSGSARSEHVSLQAGDDRANGGRGNDHLLGEAGDDRIDARDRRGRHGRDVVDCGAGDDTALVDDDDVVRHCEHVERAADDHGVDAPGTDDKGGTRSGGTDDPVGHR